MHQAADEAGLELNMEIPSAATATVTSTATKDQDELSQRYGVLTHVKYLPQLTYFDN